MFHEKRLFWKHPTPVDCDCCHCPGARRVISRTAVVRSARRTCHLHPRRGREGNGGNWDLGDWCYLPSGKHTKNYWKLPLIVDLPIKNGDFPVRYVSLPEGTHIFHGHQILFLKPGTHGCPIFIAACWFMAIFRRSWLWITEDLSILDLFGSKKTADLRDAKSPRVENSEFSEGFFWGFPKKHTCHSP